MPLQISVVGTHVPPVVVPGRAGPPSTAIDVSAPASSAIGVCTTPASSIHASMPSASSPVRPHAGRHTRDHSKLRTHHVAKGCESFESGWHTVGTAKLDRGLGRLNLRAAFFVLL